MAATPPFPSRQRHDDNPDTPASQKKRLDGLWNNGHWWCNCEPRKKAGLARSRKTRPTKAGSSGRARAIRTAAFFLWREEVRAREAESSPAADELLPPPPKTPTFTQRPLRLFGVQVSPGRSEADSSVVHVTDLSACHSSGSTMTVTASAAPASGNAASTTPCPTFLKRSRDAFECGDDDFSDFGSDEERQLVEIVDSSAGKSSCEADPPSGRAVAGAMDPPSPSVARTLFPGPESKRQKTVSFDGVQPTGLPTPTKSPAASRLGDSETPSGTPLDADSDNVIDYVVALLKDQPIDGAVRSVRERLFALARKIRGIAMGRESVRAALRAKNDQIARLQERVAALEKTGNSQRSQPIGIKAQLM